MCEQKSDCVNKCEKCKHGDFIPTDGDAYNMCDICENFDCFEEK